MGAGGPATGAAATAGNALDAALCEMEIATERIRSSLLVEAEPGELTDAWARRGAAFERAIARARDGERPGPEGRGALERLRELDAALLRDVPARLAADREALRDLSRRRGALQAHGRRERTGPLALTVKA